MNGSEAELVMDIICKKVRIERIHIRNGFGQFGTKSFSEWGSRSTSGPWRHLKDGELPKLDDQVDSNVNQYSFACFLRHALILQ